jgi:1,4-alpha-glucan branching enzyme/maltooligosyltrehalose trehalohydrolase
MAARLHDMPFGCEMQNDGTVRFRLWAPAATEVELCLKNETDSPLAMAAQAEGWFELTTPRAVPDSHYCFRIDGGKCVPDPASRYQPDGVHGYSLVVDPQAWAWQDDDWRGRPWHEAVCYELHIGSFTPQGTFAAARERLDHLIELGITALQLMPLAECPGARNWGYDGAQLFAPEQRYGTPDDLKALIDTAHAKGLMVFLDVVYNHFGPEGNYLHLYAPQFFTEHHHTPWGKAINFDDESNHWVREFFIHNACYWLEEYHFDGLRLDAVHAIVDDSSPDILIELAQRARQCSGGRHIHLILENDNNVAHYLVRDEHGAPRYFSAQWNDDSHHAMHVLLTGEDHDYYGDYADAPLQHLGRSLSEGFAYQGQASDYRGGKPRGERSAQLPATAFISFLQNHDTVGNRAHGERISMLAEERAVRAALAVLLLAPAPPLLFMGQEWNSHQPFPFFCDFGPELAQQVTQGRCREFASFPGFDDDSLDQIPDPQQPSTFDQAVLDWHELDKPAAQSMLAFHHDLLVLRHRQVVPHLSGIAGGESRFSVHLDSVLQVMWQLNHGVVLSLFVNFGSSVAQGIPRPSGNVLFATEEVDLSSRQISLTPWSVLWYLDRKPSPS